MRKCSKCQEEKPDEAFSSRGAYCRACAREYNRKRYAENKASIREKQNAWRRANRGKHEGYNRAYRIANTDRALATGRLWAKANPVRRFASQSLGLKRRSGHVVTLTVQDVLDLWDEQKGLCALSGLPMASRFDQGKGGGPESPSLDRIKPSEGYTPGNVRLLRFAVNAGRGTLTDDEFVEVCRAIVTLADQKKSG